MFKSPKSVIRKKILSLLRNQKEDERLKKSKAIQKKLFALRIFKKAKIILFYASFDGEVETFSMMKQAQKLGKKIALPKIIRSRKKMTIGLVEDFRKELMNGPYGIKEPKKECFRRLELKDVDLAIVPAVAFDKARNRLGRGGGYYDRFLKKFPVHIPTVGLAFDFQILNDLPHHKRDIAVSRVICSWFKSFNLFNC